MACNCGNPTVVPTTPKCKDCLVAKSFRWGCDDSPAPCGITATLDLAEYNTDNSVCKCATKYSIVRYDKKAFTNVSVTELGVLTYTTTDDFTKLKEYEIVYKLDCPCSPQSASGTIYICKKDLCKGLCADGDCNQCNGECLIASDQIIEKSVSPLSTCSGTGTINIADDSTFNGCGSNIPTYSIVATTDGLIDVTISNSGIITFSKIGTIESDQEIHYRIMCGQLKAIGSVVIQIKDLCEGIAVPNGQYCDKCDGTLKNITSNIQIS